MNQILRLDPAQPVVYDNTPFEQVKKYDYLGVIIDERLTFEDHINKLISKSHNKIYTLGRLRKYIDPGTAVQIVKTYIPRIEYADLLVEGINKSSLFKLQKAINLCLHICFCTNRYTSNFQLHANAKLLPFFYRRKINLLKQMYHCSFDPCYVEITNLRRGRSATQVKLKTSFPYTNKYRQSIFYIGPKLWDNLPKKI